jgi:hypothetical protein
MMHVDPVGQAVTIQSISAAPIVMNARTPLMIDGSQSAIKGRVALRRPSGALELAFNKATPASARDIPANAIVV